MKSKHYYIICIIIALLCNHSYQYTFDSKLIKTIDIYNSTMHIGLWVVLSQQKACRFLQNNAYSMSILSYLIINTVLDYFINKINEDEIDNIQEVYNKIKLLEYAFQTATNIHLHTIKEIHLHTNPEVKTNYTTINPNTIDLEDVIKNTALFPHLQSIILTQLRIWQQTEFMISTNNFEFLQKLYNKSTTNIKLFTQEYFQSLTSIQHCLTSINENVYDTLEIEDL